MNWQEAKSGTLRQWIRIRSSIESRDELQLLTDINAVCDLCTTARDEAATAAERCDHCHFYQQFGGCQEINWQMTRRVTEKDWDGLRDLVDSFIANLRAMDTPAQGTSSTG
jgi:hypothetical protein